MYFINQILFVFGCARLYESANLKMVQIIWRHGDRAPGGLPYPNDRYNESYWPRGWDQLTNKGIWQAVELGIWFRNRYGNNLLPKFDLNKVYIRSTDSERAIETAQAVSAGLFPPNGDRVWESSYLKYWQPTPIHTNGDALDALLRPTKVKCPNYDKVNAEEEAPIADKINREYSQLFTFLKNATGMETVDFWNINDLYDVQREIDHNMPQGKWLDQVFNGTTIMDHVREMKRITRNQEFNSKSKAKFRGGMLVNEFLKNMEDYNSNKSSLNALMYSTHDGTLSAFLYALNVSNDLLVPYTAAIIFELYDDNTVQLYYKNTTTATYPLIIPGCQQSCPLTQFSSLLESTRVRSLDELYQLCGTNTSVTQKAVPLITTTPFYLQSSTATSTSRTTSATLTAK